jgi:hypothetical protein
LSFYGHVMSTVSSTHLNIDSETKDIITWSKYTCIEIYLHNNNMLYAVVQPCLGIQLSDIGRVWSGQQTRFKMQFIT